MNPLHAPLDPFRVLGLEPTYDLDQRSLRSAWMRSAAAGHPDAAGSLESSTCVNDAFRVLSDPVLRADTLLRLWNAPEVDSRRMPDGFLVAMMDLRERADELKGDAGALAELRAVAEEGRQGALRVIAQLFAREAASQISGESAQAIQMQINVARSYERMIEQLDREADPR